jgi:hypothetical protein
VVLIASIFMGCWWIWMGHQVLCKFVDAFIARLKRLSR